MTEYIKTFVFLLISSALVQNLVFSRGIGISAIVTTGKKQQSGGFAFCLFVTVMSAVSSFTCYFLRVFLEARECKDYVYPLVFVVVTAILYAIIYIALGLISPKLHEKYKLTLTEAAFSCALFGTLMLAYFQKLSLDKTVVFALGTGIGYTIAGWVIEEGKRRIDTARVPEAFRGIPVLLIYIGIISLALFGFIGSHALPF